MATIYDKYNIKFCLVEPGGIKTHFLVNVENSLDYPDDTIKDMYQKTIDGFTKAMSGPSSQTPEEVAKVIKEVIDNPVNLRTQTNDGPKFLAKTKFVDPTGNQGIQMIKSRFFPQ